MVDDYGRYEADPEIVRSKAFPFGEPNGDPLTLPAVAGCLCALAQADMLSIYQVNNSHYLELSRWKENKRSKPRYPAISEGLIVPFDNICKHLLAPPASSATSTSPPPSTRAGGFQQQHEIELPDRFPVTIDDAIARAVSLGCPSDFVMKAYDKALSRGGHDSQDIPIRNWERWLSVEWKYEQARKAKDRQNGRRNEPNI